MEPIQTETGTITGMSTVQVMTPAQIYTADQNHFLSTV
nr:unnamed protein product [Callosobruchus analis]